MNCDKIELGSFHLIMALVWGQEKDDSTSWGKGHLWNQCHWKENLKFFNRERGGERDEAWKRIESLS